MKILTTLLSLLVLLASSRADDLKVLITKDWKFEECLKVEGRQDKEFDNQDEMKTLLEQTGISNFKELKFLSGKSISTANTSSFSISYKPLKGFESAHKLRLFASISQWKDDYDSYPKPLPEENDFAIRFNMKRIVQGKTQYIRISCPKDASRLLFQFITPK
jgi:hypothetical protein